MGLTCVGREGGLRQTGRVGGSVFEGLLSLPDKTNDEREVVDLLPGRVSSTSSVVDMFVDLLTGLFLFSV